MKIFFIILIFIILRIIYIIYQYKNPIFIEGIKIPRYVKSDHQKLDISSLKFKNYMDSEIRTMSKLHDFCTQNNIVYTFVAGSLMSCITLNTYFPWDDDIDLVVREEDWGKIYNLWEQGQNERTIGDPRWRVRDTVINGESFIILLNKDNEGWIKLVKTLQKLPDVGGIDIGYAFEKDGKMYESMNRSKEVPSLSKIVITKYHSIPVMTVTKQAAIDYFNRIYTGWDIKEHPDYKKSLFRIVCSRLFSFKS